jgi:uncharacterized protein (DUF2236 family)
VYRLLRRPSAKPLWWISLGTLPAPVRERIGERWTARDQRRHERFRGAVRAVWRVVPPRLRYTERARRGYARAGIGPVR